MKATGLTIRWPGVEAATQMPAAREVRSHPLNRPTGGRATIQARTRPADLPPTSGLAPYWLGSWRAEREWRARWERVGQAALAGAALVALILLVDGSADFTAGWSNFVRWVSGILA